MELLAHPAPLVFMDFEQLFQCVLLSGTDSGIIFELRSAQE
jgi:hypothetical protein